MAERNGGRWLSDMTQTLVALLLVAAVTGSIWTAIEVRTLSTKMGSAMDRMNRIDDRVRENRSRIIRAERRYE